MQLTKQIFRAYDIRGIADKTLTSKIVYQIGQAIGTKVVKQNKTPQVVVGRDGRLSGKQLSDALISGLLATGCEVVSIGAVPTPVLYFAAHKLNINSAIQVTGSHNPPEYNGLKIILDGKAIYGDAILELYEQILQQKFATGTGNVKTLSIDDEYINCICKKLPSSKMLKIVIDCGNGIAGKISPTLYQQLGCEIIPLYCEVDGNFPNHHPDPGDPTNLIELQRAVLDNKADLGLAFDGDGDRLGIIDNNGKIIWPDRALMLFAKDVLSRNPGATIIYDIKSTRDIKTIVNQNHGTPLMWKTGHSLIKAKMLETKALLAGEMSGHFFFKENWFGFDDALYAGAKLISLINQSNSNASEIFRALPENISTPELAISVTEQAKFSIVEQLIEIAKFPEAENIETLDGLRVDFPEGWGLVRPSNTSPKLVIRFEATSKEILHKIQTEFKTMLLNIDPTLVLPF